MSVVGPSRHFAAATIRRLSGAQRTLANRPPSGSSAAAQEAPDIHGYAEQHLERLAARIIEHQHGSIGFAHELQWPHCPRAIEFVVQLVFVCEAIEGRTRRVVEAGATNSTARRLAHRRVASRDERRVRCPPTIPESHHPSTRCSVNAAPPDKLRGRAFRLE